MNDINNPSYEYKVEQALVCRLEIENGQSFNKKIVKMTAWTEENELDVDVASNIADKE